MRHLTEPRKLAAAELVEDLSGLLLREVVHFVALVAREEAQRPGRDVGIPAERLVRRDEAVATERHRVPGDAGRRVRAALVELEQSSQVQRAPCDEALVEQLGARRVARARSQEAPVARVERVDRIVEAIRRRRRRGAVLTRDRGELELEELLWPERARHAENVALDRVGRGPKGDLGRATDAVAADALEDEATFSRTTRRGELSGAESAIGAELEHLAG